MRDALHLAPQVAALLVAERPQDNHALVSLVLEWRASARAQVASADGRTAEQVAETCPLALGSAEVVEWLREDGR